MSLLLLLGEVAATAALCRAPAIVGPTAPRIIADPFDAPNLLLTTLASQPAQAPFVVRDSGNRTRVVRVVLPENPSVNTLLLSAQTAKSSNEPDSIVPVASIGSTHSEPLTLGIPPPPQTSLARAASVTPRTLSKRIDRFEPPNLLLTTLAAAVEAPPPFVSRSFETRAQARPRLPDVQGSLLGLYGVRGWGPVIQEFTDGRVLKRITRVEQDQPPNLLLFTLAAQPQAIPIGKQGYDHKRIARPIAADVPPNTLLTTLAQQPQALPIGKQWSATRPIRRPTEAEQPPNLLLGPLSLQVAPKPIGAQWFDDYSVKRRTIHPGHPPINTLLLSARVASGDSTGSWRFAKPARVEPAPNLLLSTLRVIEQFPVSVHNAHWEFERQITQNVVSAGTSFAAPLLTLGIEPSVLRESFVAGREISVFVAPAEEGVYLAAKEAGKFNAT